MRRPVEDADLNQQKEDEQNDGHRHLTVEGAPRALPTMPITSSPGSIA